MLSATVECGLDRFEADGRQWKTRIVLPPPSFSPELLHRRAADAAARGARCGRAREGVWGGGCFYGPVGRYVTWRVVANVVWLTEHVLGDGKAGAPAADGGADASASTAAAASASNILGGGSLQLHVAGYPEDGASHRGDVIPDSLAVFPQYAEGARLLGVTVCLGTYAGVLYRVQFRAPAARNRSFLGEPDPTARGGGGGVAALPPLDMGAACSATAASNGLLASVASVTGALLGTGASAAAGGGGQTAAAAAVEAAFPTIVRWFDVDTAVVGTTCGGLVLAAATDDGDTACVPVPPRRASSLASRLLGSWGGAATAVEHNGRGSGAELGIGSGAAVLALAVTDAVCGGVFAVTADGKLRHWRLLEGSAPGCRASAAALRATVGRAAAGPDSERDLPTDGVTPPLADAGTDAVALVGATLAVRSCAGNGEDERLWLALHARCAGGNGASNGLLWLYKGNDVGPAQSDMLSGEPPQQLFAPRRCVAARCRAARHAQQQEAYGPVGGGAADESALLDALGEEYLAGGAGHEEAGGQGGRLWWGGLPVDEEAVGSSAPALVALALADGAATASANGVLAGCTEDAPSVVSVWRRRGEGAAGGGGGSEGGSSVVVLHRPAATLAASLDPRDDGQGCFGELQACAEASLAASLEADRVALRLLRHRIWLRLKEPTGACDAAAIGAAKANAERAAGAALAAFFTARLFDVAPGRFGVAVIGRALCATVGEGAYRRLEAAHVAANIAAMDAGAMLAPLGGGGGGGEPSTPSAPRVNSAGQPLLALDTRALLNLNSVSPDKAGDGSDVMAVDSDGAATGAGAGYHSRPPSESEMRAMCVAGIGQLLRDRQSGNGAGYLRGAGALDGYEMKDDEDEVDRLGHDPDSDADEAEFDGVDGAAGTSWGATAAVGAAVPVPVQSKSYFGFSSGDFSSGGAVADTVDAPVPMHLVCGTWLLLLRRAAAEAAADAVAVGLIGVGVGTVAGAGGCEPQFDDAPPTTTPPMPLILRSSTQQPEGGGIAMLHPCVRALPTQAEAEAEAEAEAAVAVDTVADVDVDKALASVLSSRALAKSLAAARVACSATRTSRSTWEGATGPRAALFGCVSGAAAATTGAGPEQDQGLGGGGCEAADALSVRPPSLLRVLNLATAACAAVDKRASMAAGPDPQPADAVHLAGFSFALRRRVLEEAWGELGELAAQLPEAAQARLRRYRGAENDDHMEEEDGDAAARRLTANRINGLTALLHWVRPFSENTEMHGDGRAETAAAAAHAAAVGNAQAAAQAARATALAWWRHARDVMCLLAWFAELPCITATPEAAGALRNVLMPRAAAALRSAAVARWWTGLPRCAVLLPPSSKASRAEVAAARAAEAAARARGSAVGDNAVDAAEAQAQAFQMRTLAAAAAVAAEAARAETAGDERSAAAGGGSAVGSLLASGALLPSAPCSNDADAMVTDDKGEDVEHSARATGLLTGLLRRRAACLLCCLWLPAAPAPADHAADDDDGAADDDDGAGSSGQRPTLAAAVLLKNGFAGGAAALAALAMADNATPTDHYETPGSNARARRESLAAALRWASSAPPGDAAERAWCMVLTKALVLRASARAMRWRDSRGIGEMGGVGGFGGLSGVSGMADLTGADGAGGFAPPPPPRGSATDQDAVTAGHDADVVAIERWLRCAEAALCRSAPPLLPQDREPAAHRASMRRALAHYRECAVLAALPTATTASAVGAGPGASVLAEAAVAKAGAALALFSRRVADCGAEDVSKRAKKLPEAVRKLLVGGPNGSMVADEDDGCGTLGGGVCVIDNGKRHFRLQVCDSVEEEARRAAQNGGNAASDDAFGGLSGVGGGGLWGGLRVQGMLSGRERTPVEGRSEALWSWAHVETRGWCVVGNAERPPLLRMEVWEADYEEEETEMGALQALQAALGAPLVEALGQLSASNHPRGGTGTSSTLRRLVAVLQNGAEDEDEDEELLPFIAPHDLHAAAQHLHTALSKDGEMAKKLDGKMGFSDEQVEVEAEEVEAEAEANAERVSGALGALGVAADIGESALCAQLHGLLQDELRSAMDSGAGAGGARTIAGVLVDIARRTLDKAFGNQRVRVGEDGVRRKLGQYDFEVPKGADDDAGNEAATSALDSLRCWAEVAETRRVLRSMAFRNAVARAATLSRVAHLQTAAARQEAEAAEAVVEAEAALSNGSNAGVVMALDGGMAASTVVASARAAKRTAATARRDRARAARRARDDAVKALRAAIDDAAATPDSDTRRAHFAELAAAACDGAVGSGLYALGMAVTGVQLEAMSNAVTAELLLRARTVSPHLACAALTGSAAKGGAQSHPLLQLMTFHSACGDHAAAAAAAHRLERSLAGFSGTQAGRVGSGLAPGFGGASGNVSQGGAGDATQPARLVRARAAALLLATTSLRLLPVAQQLLPMNQLSVYTNDQQQQHLRADDRVVCTVGDLENRRELLLARLLCAALRKRAAAAAADAQAEARRTTPALANTRFRGGGGTPGSGVATASASDHGASAAPPLGDEDAVIALTPADAAAALASLGEPGSALRLVSRRFWGLDAALREVVCITARRCALAASAAVAAGAGMMGEEACWSPLRDLLRGAIAVADSSNCNTSSLTLASTFSTPGALCLAAAQALLLPDGGIGGSAGLLPQLPSCDALHPLPRWLEQGCYVEEHGWAAGGVANADPLCRAPGAVLGVEAPDGPNSGAATDGAEADAMEDEGEEGDAGGVADSRRLSRFGRGAFGRASATCAVRGLADVVIGVHGGADCGDVTTTGALGGAAVGIGAGANTACGGIGGGIGGVGVASGSGLGLALPGTCHVGYGDGTELRTTADWRQLLPRGALFALGESGCGGTYRVAHDRVYSADTVPLAPADATSCALASRHAARQGGGGAVDSAASYSGVELSGVVAYRAAPLAADADQRGVAVVASSANVENMLGPRRAPAFAVTAADEAAGADRTVGGHDPAALVDLYLRVGAVEAAARLAHDLVDARGLHFWEDSGGGKHWNKVTCEVRLPPQGYLGISADGDPNDPLRAHYDPNPERADKCTTTWLPYQLIDRVLAACEAKLDVVDELLVEEQEMANAATQAAQLAGTAPLEDSNAVTTVIELMEQRMGLMQVKQDLHKSLKLHLEVTRNTNQALTLTLGQRRGAMSRR